MRNDPQDRRGGAGDASDDERRLAYEPADATEELVGILGRERVSHGRLEGLFVALEAVHVFISVDILVAQVRRFHFLGGVPFVEFIDRVHVGRFQLLELVGLVRFVEFVVFLEAVVKRVRGSFCLIGEILVQILLVKRHGRSPFGSRRNAGRRH